MTHQSQSRYHVYIYIYIYIYIYAFYAFYAWWLCVLCVGYIYIQRESGQLVFPFGFSSRMSPQKIVVLYHLTVTVTMTMTVTLVSSNTYYQIIIVPSNGARELLLRLLSVLSR